MNLKTALKNKNEFLKLLSEADIATLTLVLSQLTNDLKYVERIRPFVKGAFDYSVKIPEALSLEIKQELIHVLENKYIKNNNLSDYFNLKNKYIKYLMSVGVGENVPDEYVPMMKEELAIDGDNIRDLAVEELKNKDTDKINVIIIGAGLCGILAGIKLLQANIPFQIIEKNNSIGGTWYENSYPGCGVDTPNHVYAYSFEPSFHWEDFYSKRDSIYEYLKSCVDKYGLSKHIKLNTHVKKIFFNQKSNIWETQILKNNKSKLLKSSIVISAVGQLNNPVLPKIKGIESFENEIIHTGSWDHNYEFKNKDIALIGTGASSMQVAPELAKIAKKLTIFQRTPHWIIANPNYHRKLTKGKKWVLENIPFYSRWYRFQLFWGFCDGIHESLCVDPKWKYLDRSINYTNDRFRINIIRYIESIIGDDPELMKKVIPDYPPYGKRMLIDNHWFKMLKRDNVELIDEKISHIGLNSIVTIDKKSFKKDVIVAASGFNAGKMLFPMEVIGKNGVSIRDFWENDNPRANLGITVPNFPNFFIMYGPNTNLAHGGSIVFHGECQIRYILGCINLLIDKNSSTMDCKKDVFENYNKILDDQHSKMVWTHNKVNSWYRNSNGRVTTNSPWRLVDYWHMTKKPKESDFVFN